MQTTDWKMSDPQRLDASKTTFPWWRRSEQLAWALCLILMLVTMVAYLWQQNRLQHRLIEIDRAELLTADFKIDLNSADWPELTVLPGISETYARRIIEHRTQHGDFTSVDDLQSVPGIGAKTVDRIREYLMVTQDARFEAQRQATRN